MTSLSCCVLLWLTSTALKIAATPSLSMNLMFTANLVDAISRLQVARGNAGGRRQLGSATREVGGEGDVCVCRRRVKLDL